MPRPLYYLTFRRILEPALDGSPRYDEQVTVFTEAAPNRAWYVLKKGGFRVAYGREGDKPVKDSHPNEQWDDVK